MNRPLYTAELTGEYWEKGQKYEMVIITKWKDKTEASSEEAHKAFYFASNCEVLRTKIRNPYWLRHIYETYKENTKFKETIVFEVVEDNF